MMDRHHKTQHITYNVLQTIKQTHRNKEIDDESLDHQKSQLSGQHSVSYSGGLWFRSRSVDWLSSLRFFMVLLGPPPR